MRTRMMLIGLALGLCSVPALAQLTLNRPLPEPTPYAFDSGIQVNADLSSKVVAETIVRIDTAAWMRIYFGDVELGAGSFLRITSELDGEVQELDAAALDMWQNSTAYFNGDTLRVEIVAGPNTRGNRLVIDSVAWEASAVPVGGCGICGPDDRVLSNSNHAARLFPAGCSATVYNTQSCVVTAGHCVSGGMVLQFNVPVSNSNCSLNQPPIADQFPAATFQFSNGGVGNDWGALTMGTNNLGEKPFERYGVLMPLASTPPAGGNALTIWGYGVDEECIKNQAQQTSDGAISSTSALFFNHTVDATFGNSGSSVVRNGTEVVGIATHCPCPNVATRIDHPAFVAARQAVCPSNVPQAATLLSANVIAGTPIAVNLASLAASDDDYVQVDSVLGGPRENTLTEVTIQSPLASVSGMTVRVEYGAAIVSPLFYSVQIRNQDTGAFQGLNFGIVSTTTDTVVDIDTVDNPNAYIDGTGKIQLRVAETARSPQAPDGFIQLIDHVQVTVFE